MRNFMVSFNKFIKNKNTVTIIGIILILVLLYYGYNRTVNSTIQPVEIPVANKNIGERTEITSNDIKYQKVASILLNDNVIRNNGDIIGKYSNINVTIPEGSMFYKSWLVEKNQIPGSWIEEINTEEGYEAYYFSTDAIKTLGNNVIPDSYIDLYMSVTNDNGELMYGRLLKDIKVLVVHDGGGKDVFADPSNIGSPSKLGFEVSHDFYVLLYKAEHMGEVTLEIAPQGEGGKNKQGIFVSSQTLRDYIDTHTANLTDEISINPDTKKNSNTTVTDKKS